ncbi:MAG: helix-turn-helix domain-containing protein [Steroidobacteraceae bacterium]
MMKGMCYGDSERKTPLHYTGCGLDDVYLCSGYELIPAEDGDDLVIQDIDGLHRAIGEFLARHKKGLSGKEFRFLRKQMNLTQSELATLMGSTDQAVARWEKAKSRIPGSSETLIRVMYLGHVEKEFHLHEVLRDLRSADAPVIDRQLFTETEDGWKAAA